MPVELGVPVEQIGATTELLEKASGTWQDLPITLFGVVNALADLEVKRVVSAVLSKTETIGTGGMGETIILE